MKDRASIFSFVAIGFFLLLASNITPLWASPKEVPFVPGEKLEYQLRWENVPAGSAWLEVLPVKNINGQQAYHFVMVAESNAFVDIFYKVRDRIDAFADMDMSRSVLYSKKQREGSHEKDEVIEFDWDNGHASYSNYGEKKDPIALMAGSFDPLSAFYFSRTMTFDVGHQLERPITDGQKNVIGRLKVVGRETIELLNGKTYDTYLIEPEMNHVGGVFKESEGAKIQLWVTADEKRIPVRIQSKVAVGHFIGELVSANGI
ncbi:MAG: DUF3108 domain-containing protein [Desulfobacteraceae bacterium]|nr:DUF3108 domain-containing protein [Desulfobacteraceae bacterium]